MASSNEWEKYYHESFTTSPMNRGGSKNSTTSHNNNGDQLTPTGSVAKPIRRRSRVSKKTPITLLNANANNFRALVQELTGCTDAASSTPISFGNNQKGPINLSFGNPNYSYSHQQQQQQQREPLLQVQQNLLHEEQKQQHVYPFEGDHDHVFHYSSSSSGYYDAMQYGMEIGDGFEVMDQEDISLHELLD